MQDHTERLVTIEDEADFLMECHGLKRQGWTFAWDNAKVRAGQCSHRKQQITLSRHLMPLWPKEQVRDTILHEIAHALVGPGHGHDWYWKAKCRQIGADPSRCYEGDKLPAVAAEWNGHCPMCQRTFTRHRRPTRVTSCGQHGGFRLEAVIRWTNSAGATPGGKWTDQLIEIAAGRQEVTFENVEEAA